MVGGPGTGPDPGPASIYYLVCTTSIYPPLPSSFQPAMVRQKSRWIIARLDFEEDVTRGGFDESVDKASPARKRRRVSTKETSSENGAQTKQSVPPANPQIESKNIYWDFRRTFESCYGASGAGLVHGVKLLLYDPVDRLAVLKVPRELCGQARSALTLLTAVGDRPVVASIVAVNGSARTCKTTVLTMLRRNFKASIQIRPTEGSAKLRKQDEKLMLKLERRMAQIIREID